MKRFFEKFSLRSPMQEITESDAKARESYVVEMQAPRRYELFVHGDQVSVFYADPADFDAVAADYRARYADKNAQLQRVLPPDEEGTTKTRIWYFAGGELEKSIITVYQNESPNYRTYLYSPEDELLDTKEFVHDDYGLAEIVTYDADGNELRRQWVGD